MILIFKIKNLNIYLNIIQIRYIVCSTVLKDGRFVTGSADSSIIIYNNKTFKPDFIIKEHKNQVLQPFHIDSTKIIELNNK